MLWLTLQNYEKLARGYLVRALFFKSEFSSKTSITYDEVIQEILNLIKNRVLEHSNPLLTLFFKVTFIWLNMTFPSPLLEIST